MFVFGGVHIENLAKFNPKKRRKINRICTRIRKTSKNLPISLSKIAKFRQNKNTGQEVAVVGGDENWEDEFTGRISSDPSM